jgi:hypothetical protein
VRTADQPLQMNPTIRSVSGDPRQYCHPRYPLRFEDANQRLVERLALPLVPLVENRENELDVSRECSSRATDRRHDECNGDKDRQAHESHPAALCSGCAVS